MKKEKGKEKQQLVKFVDYLVDPGFDGEINPATKALVKRLRNDLKMSASMIGAAQARYNVDSYYEVQKFRVATGNQVRALSGTGEPTILIGFLHENLAFLEETIRQSMGEFASQYAVGRWLQGICGIGRVLSAGFLVGFDIRRKLWLVSDKKNGSTGSEWKSASGDVAARVKKKKLFVMDEKYAPRATAGTFWKFAGLTPDLKWGKGKKRPWSAKVKVLCYKAGDQFIKQQNREGDVYGKWYVKRKAYEAEMNEAGKFADQAAQKLKDFKIGKDTDAYKAYSAGKLPKGHIDARARRWVEKLFLSNLHRVMYLDYTGGQEPPDPYVFSKYFKDSGLHTGRFEGPPFDRKNGKPLSDLFAIGGKKKGKAE